MMQRALRLLALTLIILGSCTTNTDDTSEKYSTPTYSEQPSTPAQNLTACTNFSFDRVDPHFRHYPIKPTHEHMGTTCITKGYINRTSHIFVNDTPVPYEESFAPIIIDGILAYSARNDTTHYCVLNHTPFATSGGHAFTRYNRTTHTLSCHTRDHGIISKQALNTTHDAFTS